MEHMQSGFFWGFLKVFFVFFLGMKCVIACAPFALIEIGQLSSVW